jgi:hypothetical protein
MIWIVQYDGSVDVSKLSDTRIGALIVCNSARAVSHLVKRATAVLQLVGTLGQRCVLVVLTGCDPNLSCLKIPNLNCPNGGGVEGESRLCAT